MYNNNQSCITLAKNPKKHSCSKYINVQYYYFKQLLKYRKIRLDYYLSINMFINVLTKLLGYCMFKECSYKLVSL